MKRLRQKSRFRAKRLLIDNVIKGTAMRRTISLSGGPLGLLLCANAALAAPSSLQPVYGKITDGPDCAYEQSATEENDILYDCPGPVSGVRTLLHRGGDWDHLSLLIDDQRYSLWEPMVAVGSWSGVGNKKGVVEWLFAAGKPRNRAALKALIVRFEGTILNADGDTKGTRSLLAVFDLSAGRLCWKGNFANNTAARKAATNAACKSGLSLSEAENSA